MPKYDKCPMCKADTWVAATETPISDKDAQGLLLKWAQELDLKEKRNAEFEEFIAERDGPAIDAAAAAFAAELDAFQGIT